ncbi:amino acid ABC transporter ATP-binding protein [Microbacterium sp.]|uniref:amino acid ABC transporter ATP-binding protein n=1 Tax=Microbacterium sp. TaxID=51671 RepID=UPI002E33938B|nr:amino acid ABC transporter ATP-binding protein [Microbacterium sp.]HEX5729197.1 amino acid ABC transporter ATP-binding protein [Microbacterium sp.]
MRDPVLRLDGVRKSFDGHDVLRGIDLTVEQGEVVALIGASGSGKSTLLRTINLLERVDDGQIWLSGLDITDPRVNADLVRARIGVVFQQYNLFPHMTVLENVTMAMRHVQGRTRRDADAAGLQLLDRVGLAAKAGDHPDRLSGGQQQRAAIARAIATSPEVLLLDEITSALDPELVTEVLDLVRTLAADGATILMATHEMAFARDVAHRVVFLDAGLILEQGSPAEVFGFPKERRTQEFLARFRA